MCQLAHVSAGGLHFQEFRKSLTSEYVSQRPGEPRSVCVLGQAFLGFDGGQAGVYKWLSIASWSSEKKKGW